MADILIRGMDMPKSCGFCELRYLDDDGDCCPFVGDSLAYGTRPDGCPLNELPEHGDLIDRDKLLEEDVDLFIEYDDFEDESGCSTDVIRNAPVIVPSNKEETE